MEWFAGWPFALTIVLVVLTLWGYADAVADGQKAAERIREKLHAERLAAMEKGLPPPDSGFDEALLSYLAEGAPATEWGEARARSRTLGWAILLVAAGVGWFLACALAGDQETTRSFYQVRTFGITPVMLRTSRSPAEAGHYGLHRS